MKIENPRKPMALSEPNNTMSQIAAADNLLIEMDEGRWRLTINANFVENVPGDGLMLLAEAGKPLRYATIFAQTRRLPKSGQLPITYIQRVVLGWSWDDEAWHLGLLLSDSLAQLRGSRWCELAQWPDPDQDLYRELAVQAGEALARVLDRPFNLIPQRPAAAPPVPQVAPLPPLPLGLQGWSLTHSDQRSDWLVFVRGAEWTRERVRRAIWYSFWAVVYVLLAVATLLGDIAPPRVEVWEFRFPDWLLPALALATAVILVGQVFYMLYELRSKARRIIVDTTTQRIWGTIAQGGKPVWRLGREQVDSVYVSEIVTDNTAPDAGPEDPVTADIHYGELNLRLTDGTFYYLLRQPDAETIAHRVGGVPGEVLPLDRATLTTRLQVAAAYVAEALNVPVWYDCRQK